MAEKRNSEGYFDPTAYAAMLSIEKSERRQRRMNYKRGDIYYIASWPVTGSEQRSGRPAIIVSNDKGNNSSATVEVVYLTTQPKADLPTHVSIRSLDRESIALCEQITTVSVDRIGDFKGRVTASEMTNIEIAMLVSLDIQMGQPKTKTVEVVKEIPVPMPTPAPERKDTELEIELAAAKAKCEMLQSMYDALLSRVVKAG